ncbi:MAG TPA: hypothetical protein DGF30_09325 [Desulfomicrobium sp.]|nr:hypothetical protein [Desulfomicrobium sp.]
MPIFLRIKLIRIILPSKNTSKMEKTRRFLFVIFPSSILKRYFRIKIMSNKGDHMNATIQELKAKLTFLQLHMLLYI